MVDHPFALGKIKTINTPVTAAANDHWALFAASGAILWQVLGTFLCHQWERWELWHVTAVHCYTPYVSQSTTQCCHPIKQL